MRDLANRHSENITAHHLLATIDACSSGLALVARLGNDGQKENLSQFRALAIIRNDTLNRARNFLVAGLADQPALWDNGGIFTAALIAGLEGKADSNGDNIIQFAELANFVTNEVAQRASMRAVIQKVQSTVLDAYGDGKVLFFAE